MTGVANAGMMMPVYLGTQEVNSIPGTSDCEHEQSAVVGQQNPVVTSESQSSTTSQQQEPASIDIVINNVVSTFSTRCHLNLKKIATEGVNVIFKRENGMVNMKLRNPRTTASIWSSGKLTCTGATSEEDSKKAARRFSRVLQKLGFRVRLANFRVVNVLATCTFPFGIRITHFSRDHPQNASYEPELHPGVTYRIKEPKATLKIFSTGSITVTAPSVHNVQCAIEHIYPLVVQYRMDDIEKIEEVAEEIVSNGGKIEQQMQYMPNHRNITHLQKRQRRLKRANETSESDFDSDTSEDNFDSDESQD